MHVLTPSLTLRSGILVSMVSCGMVGMAGVIILLMGWCMYLLIRM